MGGVELIVGGWFASNVIGKVVDLGRSYLGDNYKLHTETREMLRNLEIQLPQIQSVIEAAEKRQITNKGLDTWLGQLKDAAYEAEDVLDHFEAKLIRESIKGKGKVNEIVSSAGKMVKNVLFSDKDLKKLKSVVENLDKHCMRVGNFIALQDNSDKGKEHLGNGTKTSSDLAGVTIFGRSEEIKLILNMILNDPNLQKGEGEGSSIHSDTIFRNLLSWGLPRKLVFVRTVIKSDTLEQSQKGLLGKSEPGKSMPSGTIKKGDALEQSKEEALGLSESGKSIFGGTVKKGDAQEQIERGCFGLRKFGKSMFHGTFKMGEVPEQIKEGLSGLSESGKSMFSGTVMKGDAPKESKNTVTTIIPIVEPHFINNPKVAVIPIVGLGGVGKSTVAEVIYNDKRVKDYFPSRAWVSVENKNAMEIMKEILCSFDVVWCYAPGCPQDLKFFEQILIKTIKKNRRFLLVLDNLTDRTKHIWSSLRSVLYYGEVGGVVVVTTQSTSIANAIGTQPEVKLGVLEQDSFWELFHYYAFGGFKIGNQPHLLELSNIGKNIAGKLHGLPLAGKVIGTLLSTKLEKGFWEDICKSDWWNIEGAREEILASIGVGYSYLESELKQCFVFCSIFPKQYEFERERLVQMWIANGFIQPTKDQEVRLEKGEIRLEDIGRKWFDKLVDRTFFQPTLSDGKYVMHDLVRDLSIAFSSNEFCFVKSNDKHLPSSARHLGVYCDNSEVEWKCKKSTRLRTVILFGNGTNNNDKFVSNIFANYKGLRLLDSSCIVLETNDYINSACLSRHLRFVDLSFTGIKSIPDEVCALCHLQVLDVRGCFFDKLPKGMNKLVNLRHLYASSHTIALISSIGKLTKLQELEEFCIGKSKGHKISELKDMNEIGGHLLLSELQNVHSKEAAAESNLDKKKYLKSLELRFNHNHRDGPIPEVEVEILDALKPGPSLEILKVGSYNRISSLPGWMSPSHCVISNLREIHISHFQLRSLPAFGELLYLEHLSFHDLPINVVGSEFYGSTDVIFPSLKELTFSLMPCWIKWEDGEDGKTIFPHLERLYLKDCWELRTLPRSLTSVVEVTLSDCWKLHNIHTVQMSSLVSFSISGRLSGEPIKIDCTRLKSLEVLHLKDIRLVCFVGGLKYLVKLRKLEIINPETIQCTYEEHPLDENSHEEYEKQCLQSLTYLHLCGGLFNFRSLPRLRKLPSLHTLLIEKLFSLDCKMAQEESWFNQLTSLEKLEFRNCRSLSCLPSQLHLLTSLKKLHISSCPELRSLPENGLPTNLTELCIEKCPDLIRRCQRDQGDDWHKISHIQVIKCNVDKRS